MKTLCLSLCAFILLTFSLNCGNQSGQSPEQEPEIYVGEQPAYSFSFSSKLPRDLEPDASQAMLCEFAWNEFFALNWKASYLNDAKRGNPDLDWNYSSKGKQNPALVVWETFAHRAEYRPAISPSTKNGRPQPFDDSPHYSFEGQDTFESLDGASFRLFNNLDENSEIGSCFLFYKSQRTENLVRYQAKCNRAQYDYVRNTFASDTEVTKARKKASSNIKDQRQICRGEQNSCNCPDDVFALPCGDDASDGAVEIKTAWREYRPEDDTSRYIVRNAIYFVQDAFPKGKVLYGNKKFLLLGIHIIRKTQNFQNFIFATFEQADVVGDYGYVLDNGEKTTGPFHYPFPRLSNLPTKDAIAATKAAHSALFARQPQSKLQYYKLVGVQGNPKLKTVGSNSVIADTEVPAFFLANYVIESDSLLGRFHGANFSHPFNHEPNQLYNGHFISGGGCQGCHGVAQMDGSDFSFISASNSFQPDTRIVYEKVSETKFERLKSFFKK